MARLHEMIEETLPDLVCLHVLLSLLFGLYLRLFDRTTLPVAFVALKSQRTGAASRASQAATKLSRTVRRGLSRFRSTSTTLCHVPSSARRPAPERSPRA